VNSATAEMRHDRKARPTMSIGRLLIFAGPLLWAVLVLFHPNPGEGTPYEEIKDVVDRWLLVHVGQLILTPLLFLAVWRLLEGLSSAAARVGRAALVVWTVFFSAYDAIQGVATGVLVRHANGLAGEERDGVAKAIDFLVNDSQLAGGVSAIWVVAAASWAVVAIGAAVALHKAGAGKVAVAAALVSAVFAVHVAPAAIGLAALVVAGVLVERQRTKSALGTPAVAATGGQGGHVSASGKESHERVG
jgi:hypothetical protein